ncbi:MAG TPA: nuclear transport factor 2 family protein [Patescibacteria group bacterium]|nr:nuclear transport factor 2 family protein [Patescibacteria group bacterium]
MNVPKELEAFMEAYEAANNTHVWPNVQPFISPTATYWFTDGSYTGISAIQKAIEATFASIQNEDYKVSDIHWPVVNSDVAVCTYDFSWKGMVNGNPKSGQGRGTNVLRKHNSSWQIVHEHLSV